MSAALTLNHYLVLGAVLFAISVVGIFLNRRNLIVLLMAIELMLLAVNLNFIAFSHYLGDIDGQVFVFFILTVAAAEAAIGLAILVTLFRNRRTINVADDGSFEFPPLELTTGRWSITVTATSEQGQTASQTRSITVAFNGVTLVVNIRGGPAWIKVWVDGKLEGPQSGRVYQAGRTLTFTGKDSIHLVGYDMSRMAAEKVYERSGLGPQDVDVIVSCGVARDVEEPATAYIIQEKLGARNAYSFDLANACNGFISAIDVIDSFIATGRCEIGLVAVGDAIVDQTADDDHGQRLGDEAALVGVVGIYVDVVELAVGELLGFEAGKRRGELQCALLVVHIGDLRQHVGRIGDDAAFERDGQVDDAHFSSRGFGEERKDSRRNNE